MNYSALRERPTQFLALASLHMAAFDDLLTDFGPAWERSHRSHTLDGAVRQQPAHQKRANAVLAGTDTKLFSCSPSSKATPYSTKPPASACHRRALADWPLACWPCSTKY